MEEVFTSILHDNAWGSQESVSGPGSTRARTAALVGDLEALVVRLGIRSLLDAPCGDFHWIGEVADAVESYTGVDVVAQLVAENERRHSTERRRFLHLDLIRDPLPQADLILCRDCLVHFSFADAFRALANFRASGAGYLLTTTFVGERANVDIPTGAWRPINLELPPFSLPSPAESLDERCSLSGGLYADKRLALWRLAQL
jgi:hypothetical protein